MVIKRSGVRSASTLIKPVLFHAPHAPNVPRPRPRLPRLSLPRVSVPVPHSSSVIVPHMVHARPASTYLARSQGDALQTQTAWNKVSAPLPFQGLVGTISSVLGSLYATLHFVFALNLTTTLKNLMQSVMSRIRKNREKDSYSLPRSAAVEQEMQQTWDVKEARRIALARLDALLPNHTMSLT